MKNTALWALIALNTLLLASFVSPYIHSNNAVAQPVARVPGQYVICPGEVTGVGSEVVYIIDTANNQLGGMAFDVNGGRLDMMPSLDLNRVFRSTVQGQPNNVAPGVPGVP